MPDHGVRTMCRALRVSPSGFYAWKARKPSARHLANDQLIARMETLHRENHEAYGSERLWRALKQQGEDCGRHRVRRLRREQGIRSRRRLRYLRTKSPYQRVPTAPNRLDWPFASPGLDHVWVADITFIPTRQGWVYLAAVLDLCSRRIVGWAMSDRADQALASDALAMALGRRRPAMGAIHHSDQGSQYISKLYQQQLQDVGLTASMSRKGMPYDNAVMESFVASLKHELTHHQAFPDRDSARIQIFQYIEIFYNRKRLHSSLGCQSPDSFERMLMVMI